MPSNNMIQVLLLEPGKEAKVVEIRNDLVSMQKVVGGLIEAIYPFEEMVCLICNEEGKIQGLSPNRALYGENGEIMDVVCGTAFLCDCSGEKFGSLNQEQIAHHLRLFRYPLMFLGMDGKIFAVPYEPPEM